MNTKWSFLFTCDQLLLPLKSVMLANQWSALTKCFCLHVISYCYHLSLLANQWSALTKMSTLVPVFHPVKYREVVGFTWKHQWLTYVGKNVHVTYIWFPWILFCGCLTCKEHLVSEDLWLKCNIRQEIWIGLHSKIYK